jgi:hypothetical protein
MLRAIALALRVALAFAPLILINGCALTRLHSLRSCDRYDEAGDDNVG